MKRKITAAGILLSYVKRNLAVPVGMVTAGFIFALVFSLYELPVEPVLYATVLTLTVIIIAGLYGYYRYYRRVMTLERLKNCILVSMDELPEGTELLEKSYKELLEIVNNDRISAISHKDKMISDMSDYYSIWAHQIKTPIAALRLMKEVEADAEISEQLFRIEQYVEMVLGYIRSESISGDFRIRRYALDGIIKQSVKKYSRQFIRKKISLEYEESGEYAVTDEKWLCFILDQLLSNALKYTPSGGKISIMTVRSAEKTELHIKDTGIGIPPEDLPRLGERGFTGFNGREDKKSTGIGLYLCRKIAGKLSLELEIQSGITGGTTVIIKGLGA